MFDDRRHEFTILHDSLQHLRHSLLLEYAIFLAFDGYAYVDSTAFGCGDFHSKTRFREVYLSRIRRIYLDRRRSPGDLQGKRGRLGDVNR